LYHIDFLINRTLVYGTLKLTLTVVYVGLVIGQQAPLRVIISQANGVAIAALVQPLRGLGHVARAASSSRPGDDAAGTCLAVVTTAHQDGKPAICFSRALIKYTKSSFQRVENQMSNPCSKSVVRAAHALSNCD
jgi:hypothetical protein